MKDTRSLKVEFVESVKVSNIETSIICYALKKHVEAFYRDPANVKAFNAWAKNNRHDGSGKNDKGEGKDEL